MPEPFKTLFNPDLIALMALSLRRCDPRFEAERFVRAAVAGLDELEMMARAEHISTALELGFTGSYLDNLKTLVASLHPSKTSELSDMRSDEDGIAGWAIVPMASYVARNGMDYPTESLEALRQMTMRFSTEFAVRYFLRDHPDLALQTVADWANDENHHVRRLASEGTRPLLPWGIKLHRFVQAPKLVLAILEHLRDDPSPYVRKSVANHLNDISKNHPDLIASLAARWMMDATPEREKLVKHACRTLIKAGHPAALAVFGFGPPDVSKVQLTIPNAVRLGDGMPIDLEFTAGQDQELLIDYVLYFMRANGKQSPKVFKWTETSARAGEVMRLHKTHPYKPVTTRKDYPGEQAVAVQINGVEIARQPFQFSI